MKGGEATGECITRVVVECGQKEGGEGREGWCSEIADKVVCGFRWWIVPEGNRV